MHSSSNIKKEIKKEEAEAEAMAKFVINHSLALSLLLVLLVSVLIPFIINTPKSKPIPQRQSNDHQQPLMASKLAELGVKIEKNPPESKLAELGVTSWPKWGCPPSKFPLTFKATETVYLLEGKVIVSFDGYDGSLEIGARDLVVFPKGLKVTCDVIEAVDKHYRSEE